MQSEFEGINKCYKVRHVDDLSSLQKQLVADNMAHYLPRLCESFYTTACMGSQIAFRIWSSSTTIDRVEDFVSQWVTGAIVTKVGKEITIVL